MVDNEWIDINKHLKSENPKELTTDEVREHFINYMHDISEEWISYPNKTPRQRVEGVIHTILATIDGCAITMPGFMLAPDPHNEDRQSHIRDGLNWYPENNHCLPNGDIAGSLHDAWNTRRAK